MPARRKRTAAPLAALPPIDPTRRYPLTLAATYLDFSMPSLFRRIAEKRIRTIKDDGRTYIHGSELIRYSAQPTAPEAA